MTKLFYDCEFLEDGETIELISIGMAAEDGRELYAVNADMPFKGIMADEWLRKNVVPSLPTTEPRQFRDGLPPHGELDHTHPDVRPRYQIARMVREFIQATPDVELWAWYGAYDHVVLCQLWGRMIDLPPGVPMYTHDLKQEVDRLGNPPMPEQADELHNALADARHVKAMAEHLAALPVHERQVRERVAAEIRETARSLREDGQISQDGWRGYMAAAYIAQEGDRIARGES